MTLPSEEVRAVEQTREFLVALVQSSGPYKTITAIRLRASVLLKHYPWPGKVKEAYDVVETVGVTLSKRRKKR